MPINSHNRTSVHLLSNYIFKYGCFISRKIKKEIKKICLLITALAFSYLVIELENFDKWVLVCHCWFSNVCQDHCQVNNSNQKLSFFVRIGYCDQWQSEVEEHWKGSQRFRFWFCLYQKPCVYSCFLLIFLFDDNFLDYNRFDYFPCHCEGYVTLFQMVITLSLFLYKFVFFCSHEYALSRINHVTFYRLRFSKSQEIINRIILAEIKK